ncbi:hypothetical protein CPB83DRAFT_811995 [Crepidotus variabilis]|uniref:DUF3669 domain-containing protein n=1 Tax=Crepidotus variabilis TaxID=179855 RepID=A0A9P6EIL5_9AGAR|nr:hypothetical protein CPB83DRAFT_811995 [Crepidotus variabilis]
MSSQSDLAKRIGRGSFGEVYSVVDLPLAVKMVLVDGNSELLAKDYQMHQAVFNVLNRDSTLLFSTPQPYALHIPSTKSIATHIRSLYFPASQKTGPNLCRLYFGRALQPFPANSLDPLKTERPRKFFNSNNFPIDLEHYKRLRRVLGANLLPSPEEIIKAMGQTLALIHHSSQYDGRDIEFVLGGDGSGNAACWILDYNQMRPWDKTANEISSLCASFFHNDPYYPRPDPTDSLYLAFKRSYQEQVQENNRPLAEQFFDALEVMWATR